MSAFVVGPEQIDLAIAMAIRAEFIHQGEDFDAIGQMLLDENVKSVNYRYDENEKPEKYRYCRFPYPFSRFDAVMALSSLRYQSCEHPGYIVSEAGLWIEGLIKVTESMYDENDLKEKEDDNGNGWLVTPGIEWRGEKMADYRSIMLDKGTS